LKPESERVTSKSPTDSDGEITRPGLGDSFDGPESYHALLNAAVVEFATRGFDGARIEAIARAADYNKSLIYRHFKTKEGLFEAALKFKLDERVQQMETAPRPIAEAMLYWLEVTLENRDYIHMLIGEALHSDGEPVVDEPWRHEYYDKYIEQVREAQRLGRYPAKVDPPQVMVMLTAIVFFPVVMPQIVKLLTGHTADSPEFIAGWKQAVGAFSSGMELLASHENQGATPEDED